MSTDRINDLVHGGFTAPQHWHCVIECVCLGLFFLLSRILSLLISRTFRWEFYEVVWFTVFTVMYFSTVAMRLKAAFCTCNSIA